MEFFRTVNIQTDEKKIQSKLTLENLDLISNDIFAIESKDDSETKIGCGWGEFTLTRFEIRGGLRFALVECPNALAWTITTGFAPNPEAIVLHLTINRKTQNKHFIDEIEAFLDDQSDCLQSFDKALG